MNRIKGLKQKQGNNSFSDLIPFGTDGNLVDMSSGLNIEEELKLGGNHDVSISSDPSTQRTTVTEFYYDKTGDTVQYIIESVIDSSNSDSTSIISSLYQENQDGDPIQIKTTIIPTTGNITEVLS